MHALVAGGAGFVGGYLVDLLRREHWAVTVLDDFSRGRLETLPDGILVWNADVRRLQPDTLTGAGIDVVFDLAARVYGVRDLYAQPGRLLADNLEVTCHLVRCAVAAGIQRYVYVSSSCVYDHPAAKVPHHEDDVGLCNTSYGLSKLVGEELCRYAAQETGMAVRIARLFNVYGPRDSWQSAHVIPDFLRKAWRLATGQATDFPIIGDGAQSRDFTWAPDVARGILAIAEQGGNAVPYNLGTGQEITVRNLAHLICRLFGLDPSQVAFTHEPAPAEDIRRLAADITRAQQDLAWEPSVHLEEGLRHLKDAIVPELERNADADAAETATA
jgi:nucleoside-diphosphate-sugar epimerase